MYVSIKKTVRVFYHLYLRMKRRLLRLLGVSIGRNTIIYTSLFNFDSFFPHFIEIGSDCVISKNTFLITHDYSKNFPTEGMTSMTRGRIRVGDNTFVGIGCIILPGVEIGKNVIVGAGSVVTKSVPDNVVAAGNPARVICSLEEYMKKKPGRAEEHDDIYIKKNPNR